MMNDQTAFDQLQQNDSGQPEAYKTDCIENRFGKGAVFSKKIPGWLLKFAKRLTQTAFNILIYDVQKPVLVFICQNLLLKKTIVVMIWHPTRLA